MDPLTVQLFRVDPLTGCNNFLSFVERLDELTSRTPSESFSLLAIDMNYLKTLNETKGHLYGDSAIRWMEIVLREESCVPTYRIGGDEFAAILDEQNPLTHDVIVKNILERFSKEGAPLGIPDPAASIALIRFNSDIISSPLDVLIRMDKALVDVKRNWNKDHHSYTVDDLGRLNHYPESIGTDPYLDWVSKRLIRSFLNMGKLLDDAQQAAYVDSTSGLPNFPAAMYKLEQTLFGATISNKPFAVVLMDGDNLRLYNAISYAEGDGMIRRMSDLLSSVLRPNDFLARWRAGDEFIAILPDTQANRAFLVADRCRTTIKQAAASWQFPTSISCGIAIFPDHGNKVLDLVDKAEVAMKLAKDQGKDQVVVAS